MPRWFYTFYEQKFLNLRPLLSITFPHEFQKSKKFGHWTSGSGGKKIVKLSEKHQYQKTSTQKQTNFFLRGHFTPFISKNVQVRHHFFPLLFLNNSESLKSLDTLLREMGAKRRLNGTEEEQSQGYNRRTMCSFTNFSLKKMFDFLLKSQNHLINHIFPGILLNPWKTL